MQRYIFFPYLGTDNFRTTTDAFLSIGNYS